MPSQLKQKQKWCPACHRNTLHVAAIQTVDMGCGFWAVNLLLCLVTFGIWLPVLILLVGLGSLGNTMSPFGAKYLCQVCGRRN